MISASDDSFTILHINQTHHSKSAWWICSLRFSRGIGLSKCGRIRAFLFQRGHKWIRWGTSRILRGTQGFPSATCKSEESCQKLFYIHFACGWIAKVFSLTTRYLPMWLFYLLCVYIRNSYHFQDAFLAIAYKQSLRSCNNQHLNFDLNRLKLYLC